MTVKLSINNLRCKASHCKICNGKLPADEKVIVEALQKQKITNYYHKECWWALQKEKRDSALNV